MLRHAHSGSLWLSLALSGSLLLALALSGSLLLSEFAYNILARLTRPLLSSQRRCNTFCCSAYTYHSSDISEKMKTMILATTLFSNWPKKQLHLIWNIRLDFKVSFWYSKIDISNKCSWGGWWGFGMDPMMKFHHNYADFPAQIV